MQETTIQSKEGKNLGKENDIFFDTSTGQVQKFEVQDGQEMHEVKVADIVSSDSTKTVVKTGDPQQNKHKESEGLMEKVKHIIGK